MHKIQSQGTDSIGAHARKRTSLSLHRLLCFECDRKFLVDLSRLFLSHYFQVRPLRRDFCVAIVFTSTGTGCWVVTDPFSHHGQISNWYCLLFALQYGIDAIFNQKASFNAKGQSNYIRQSHFQEVRNMAVWKCHKFQCPWKEPTSPLGRSFSQAGAAIHDFWLMTLRWSNSWRCVFTYRSLPIMLMWHSGWGNHAIIQRVRFQFSKSRNGTNIEQVFLHYKTRTSVLAEPLIGCM